MNIIISQKNKLHGVIKNTERSLTN